MADAEQEETIIRHYYSSFFWASIPKVVGSIPTVAGHIFQARPVWIYTQSNITNINMYCYTYYAYFFPKNNRTQLNHQISLKRHMWSTNSLIKGIFITLDQNWRNLK